MTSFRSRAKGWRWNKSPDRLFPLFAPGLIAVRDHAPVDIGGVNKFHTFLHGVWIADTLRSSIKIVDCESPQKRVSQVTAAVRSPEDRRRVNVKRSATDLCALPCGCLASKGRGGLLFLYNSQLLTVRGNGTTSRILPIPVRYITQRSNPRPNPE